MSRLCSKFLIIILLFSISINTSTGAALSKVVDNIFSKSNVVDRIYLAKHNPNVVDNFGIGVHTAEAAVSSAERDYHVNIGPINGNTTANYVYASLYNPSGSGRTLQVKRLMVRANAVAAGNYVNLSVRRTTAASAGTQITASNIPKKNNNSANPVAEVRHTNVTATLDSTVDARILGQPMPGAAGYEYSMRDIVFDSTDEPIILQPGEGLAVYQEAAGDVDTRVQAAFEWEETNDTPTAQNEYLMALPRVEVAATAGYVYNSFFNPSGSGKAAVVKRVWMGSETCDNAAVYTNNIVVKRISAASAGTLVSATSIPKKHSGSNTSVMQVRHTGVTVTQVGGTNARLLHVTPCGAAGQQSGWYEYNTRPEDEQIILQPGEGLALISETTGDIDQLNRMIIEWQEVSTGSTPASEGEYLWASDKVNVAATLGANFFSAFNPSGSGKTASVKRIVMRVNATTTATYSTFNFQRISAASGGTLIAATDLPKKHTGTANSIMEVRWCGATCASAITATYVGSRSIAASGLSDSGIGKALGPAVVGQLHGMKEFVFVPNEPLILREGEGLGFYLNYLAGDIDHSIKISIEWGESASPPTAVNRYAIDIGAMPGNTGASYNYATFFNPAASGKTAIIKKTALRVNAVTTATHSPIQIKRITAASAGTQIAAANIPKKDTQASTSVMDIRRTGVTATYAQSVDSQLLAVQTPAAAASAAALSRMGWTEVEFIDDEPIIVQPGEGIVLNNNAAADADHRLYWYIEWEEVLNANKPAAQNEYMMTVGPVTGVTTSGYVYGTLFNPLTSNKMYVVTRVGVRANRTGTITAPGYIPITLRGITAASGGTQVTATNVPEKNASSSLTTAEVRRTGVTATLAGVTDSRALSVIAPGVVQQSIGILEKEWVLGDEYVLYPGEGIALYQEATAGDVNLRYYLTASWREIDLPAEPQSITFSISDNGIGFGTLLPGGTRYATGDTLGSGSDTAAAHTLSVSTNATDGYVVNLSGTTLTCASCGGATITAIGGSATAPSVGTEQFGIRASVNSGTGSVTSPYNTANWALDTASFPDTFATGAGDDVETQFGVRYMSNVAANSESGSYTGTITYIVTSTF